jgi:lipoate-protein ligase A
VDPSTLRLIETSENDPHLSIAIEEAMHLHGEKNPGVSVRIWKCSDAVVLGSSRRIGDDVHIEACKEARIPVIRRHSGGGTVFLHLKVINFTLIAPYINEYLKPRSQIRESIYFFLNPLLDALKAEGIPVEIINNGDLFLKGRKVGGNAQARKKRTILHHGTLMLDDRVAKMSRYLKIPPERRDIPHSDFVTSFEREGVRLDVDKVFRNAVRLWMTALDCDSVVSEGLTSEEIEMAGELAEKKYRREEHNLKRL